MINLRKVFHQKLKTIYANIYFTKVPDTAIFPYVVYNFNSINDTGEEFEIIEIELDIWDNKSNTTELETITQNLIDNLDKTVLSDVNFSLVLFLETKLIIVDDNPNINRRKLTFIGHLYGKD